jgi:hypothetical protein
MFLLERENVVIELKCEGWYQESFIFGSADRS